MNNTCVKSKEGLNRDFWSSTGSLIFIHSSETVKSPARIARSVQRQLLRIRVTLGISSGAEVIDEFPTAPDKFILLFLYFEYRYIYGTDRHLIMCKISHLVYSYCGYNLNCIIISIRLLYVCERMKERL